MAKTVFMKFRVSPEEKARIQRVVEVTGKDASTIIRSTFNRMAKLRNVYDEPQAEDGNVPAGEWE